MVRLCFPREGLELFNRSGVFNIGGINRYVVNEATFLTQFVKPSQVVGTGGYYSACLKLLENNESDVAFGEYAMADGSYYYVPDVKMAYAPAMFSGYEVNEYIRNQTNKPYLKYGLLGNYKAFNGETYSLIFLLCIVFILITWLFNFLLKSEAKKCPVSRFKRQVASRIAKGLHSRSLAVMTSISWFLISTPFFLMFKTSQVVTEKPFVITDYETLMKFNITIYSWMTVNKEEYFTPTEPNVKHDDLTARFFKYYMKNKIEIEEYEAKDWKNKDFINYVLRGHRRTKYLVDKKFVLISHLPAAKYYLSQFCTAASESEYFRLFAFKDDSQREILVGNAFRTGFDDPEVRKKLKRWDRMMPHSLQVDPFGLTSNFLDRNVLMAKEQRLQQLLYCQDEKLEAYEKEETFASDIDFFMALWIALSCLIAVAFYLLLGENIYHHHRKQGNRNRKLSSRASVSSRTHRLLSSNHRQETI